MEKYVVELTSEEQKQLAQLVSKGKTAVRKITHVRILLRANDSHNGPAKTDKQILEAFGIYNNTIHDIHRRFVEYGLQAALERKKQDNPSRKPEVDDDVEAHLIALRCGDPPEGKSSWNLRLLIVRKTLKKRVEAKLTPVQVYPSEKKRRIRNRDGGYALDLYKLPYNPARPKVCMNETSKQQVADVRTAITAKPGTPHRYDVKYCRCGVANIFMFIEPLGGWRRVSVTEHRKRLDWAE